MKPTACGVAAPNPWAGPEDGRIRAGQSQACRPLQVVRLYPYKRDVRPESKETRRIIVSGQADGADSRDFTAVKRPISDLSLSYRAVVCDAFAMGSLGGGHRLLAEALVALAGAARLAQASKLPCLPTSAAERSGPLTRYQRRGPDPLSIS
jgi:hypothetical protein